MPKICLKTKKNVSGHSCMNELVSVFYILPTARKNQSFPGATTYVKALIIYEIVKKKKGETRGGDMDGVKNGEGTE
jgi:hypothetical protein